MKTKKRKSAKRAARKKSKLSPALARAAGLAKAKGQRHIGAPAKRAKKTKVKKNPEARRSIVAARIRGLPGTNYFNGVGWEHYRNGAALLAPARAKEAAGALRKRLSSILAIGVWDAKTPPALIDQELAKK